ncbi:hypothetical protein NCS52_00756900 [Fusarium sp. LHS14.1]|nr:hypothetical protein NCS52_00756900 [Fusarium sp. LHS14.1]
MSNQNLLNWPHHEYPSNSYEMQQNLGNKYGFESTYQLIPPQPSQPLNQHRKPNCFNSIPWSGLGGIVLAIVSAAGIIAALSSASGKEVDSWPTQDRQIQLAVALAVLIAIANIGLAIAYHEGTALTWWIKMSQGATLAESHRYWEHSSSAFQSVLGLLRLNASKVTLVSILMAVTVANGPLIQRAALVVPDTRTQPATFHAALSTGQFSRPTGLYMTRAKTLNTLTTNFSRVLRSYTNRDPIKLDLEGCEGACSGVLVGAGFDIDCTRSSESYYIDKTPGDTWVVGGIQISDNGLYEPTKLHLNTTYKGTIGDRGDLTVTTCSLHSAIVRYPFSYANGTVTLRGSSRTVDGIVNRTEKLMYPYMETSGLGTWPSLLGGFAFALSSMFRSNVTLYFTGILALQGDGPMGYTYMNSTDAEMGTTNMTWSDPTPPIIETVRELAFRTAISFSNSTFKQTVQGSQIRTTTKYAINKEYLAASLATTFAGALAVMFLYHGFWRLGRPVTMSPLETANAFRAPATHGVDGLKTADDLAKHFKHTVVKYEIGQGKMIGRGQ